MSDAQWIASPSGTVMRGYSQSWAIADLSGNDGLANLIAGVFSDGRGGEEAAKRHARLIASAPDLLEALKETKELLRFALLSTTPEIAKEAMVFVRQADAAIAKATGQ